MRERKKKKRRIQHTGIYPEMRIEKIEDILVEKPQPAPQ